MQKGNRLARLLVAGIVAVLPWAAAAGVHDVRKATWNMQGSGQGVKWATSVENGLRAPDAPDILAIQEGGAGPGRYAMDGGALSFIANRGVTPIAVPGSRASASPLILEGYTSADAPAVVAYRWTIRTRTQVLTYFVYGVHSNVLPSGGPGRVNLYLVSSQPADAVVLMAHPWRAQSPNLRPNFGIRVGSSFFFNIHSVSSAGAAADSVARVRQIEDFVTTRGGLYDWAALGDFNADPNVVETRMRQYADTANIRLSHSCQVTQRSGGELDYMVYRNNVQQPTAGPATSTSNAFRVPIQNSDHYPVQFWQRSNDTASCNVM
jgi:hypothetical protein